MNTMLCFLFFAVAVYCSRDIFVGCFKGNAFVRHAYPRRAERLLSKEMSGMQLFAKKKKKSVVPIMPEFSRIINVNQVPERRQVLCKLLAKDHERKGLAERFNIPEISYFSANVTLSRRESVSIFVAGALEAHIGIQAGEFSDTQVLTGDFETILLNNYNAGSDMQINLDDATDFDDEVGPNGDIDIGEIASQYFALEMY